MVISGTAGLVLSAKAGNAHVTVLPELQLPINVMEDCQNESSRVLPAKEVLGRHQSYCMQEIVLV
jgi:hypothetical protein